MQLALPCRDPSVRAEPSPVAIPHAGYRGADSMDYTATEGTITDATKTKPSDVAVTASRA